MLDSWSLHSPQYTTTHSLTTLLSLSPLDLNLLSPFAILKKHTDEMSQSQHGCFPHDSLVRHGRFREITFPDKSHQLLETGKFQLEIISGVGGGKP